MTTLTTAGQHPAPVLRSPAGFDGAGSGPTAADVAAMLRRRTLLIVVLFLLFSGLTVGGIGVWWLYFPGYRATALIECVSNVPDVQLTLERTRPRQDEQERFVQSQALLLKSPDVLSRALKLTAVRETAWFRSLDPREHLLELTEELYAVPVRGTNLLKVEMECRRREDPAAIVNEVVREWYDSVRKRTAEEFASGGLEAAQQERETLDREIEEHRRTMKQWADQLPAGAQRNPAGSITHQQLLQFGEEEARLKLELGMLEATRAIYNDPEGAVLTQEDRMAVEADPQVAQLAASLFQLEQLRAADVKVYGSEHTLLKQLDAQIEAAREELTQLRFAKLDERRAIMKESVETAYQSLRQQLLIAQEGRLKAEATLQDQDSRLFDLATLEAELERMDLHREELTQYIAGMNRVKSQRTAIHVSVAQSAIDPLERSSPSLYLIPVAIFLSLGLSVGFALGLEFLNSSVRTSQDVVRHLDVAMLGLVPHADDEEERITHIELAMRDAPQSMAAEAFRRIRTSLQFSAPPERCRGIVVTSPRPDDGKTTVACNLAMVLAQGGRRVLLVDANFRRPGVPRVFSTAPDRGLSNLLVGDGDLPSYVASTDVDRLDVLGGGPPPPNPVDLLGGDRCRAFLEEAMDRYDQVIIDTPPVLLASETIVLGTMVDGVALVIRANQNSRGVARRACDLLLDGGAHLFGVILNAAPVTRGGYFREQLRTYYDYKAEPGDASHPPASSSPGNDAPPTGESDPTDPFDPTAATDPTDPTDRTDPTDPTDPFRSV